MDAFYVGLFVLQAVLAGYLELRNRSRNDSKHTEAPKDFLSFRNNYLVVYSLMMGTSSSECFLQGIPLSTLGF